MIKKSIAFHHHHPTCWVIFISSKLREKWRVFKSILLTISIRFLRYFYPCVFPNRGNWNIQDDEDQKFDQFWGIYLYYFFNNKTFELFIFTWNQRIDLVKSIEAISWPILKIIIERQYKKFTMGLRDVENIEVPGQGLRRVEILPMKTAVGFTGKSIKRMDIKIEIIKK